MFKNDFNSDEYYRCDYVRQCKDGSDEQECHRVVQNVGYNKLLPPPPLPGEQYFFLNVSYDFRQILYIDEEKNFIRITYSLQKDWYDTSLTFQNLKRNKINLISKDDRNLFYKPWITSINIENRKKEKRTGEEEIYKVVPNKEFVYNHNNKIDSQNAFLFEVYMYTNSNQIN